MAFGHRHQVAIVERIERDFRVRRAEEAIAELNLQDEPVAGAHILAFVQATRVLGEDRTAWRREFDKIRRRLVC